jgi:structure-specific recognition protein 1
MSQKRWTKIVSYVTTVLKRTLDEEDVRKLVVELLDIPQDKINSLLGTPVKAKKQKDSESPKKGRSSYILFCSDIREQVKLDNPGIKSPDIMRSMGKLWRELDDKKKYQDMAAKDKVRYETELSDYKSRESTDLSGDKSTESTDLSGNKSTESTDLSGNKSTELSEKNTKKRNPSKYNIFYAETRSLLQDEFPDMKSADISNEVRLRWKNKDTDTESGGDELSVKEKSVKKKRSKTSKMRA